MSLKTEKLIEWVERVESAPDPQWLIENFIQPDAAVLVSGPPTQSYKTWLAMAECLALASGQTIGGLRPTCRAGVLFLEQEGPRKSIADRFRKFERGYGVEIKDLNIQFAHREPFTLEEPASVADTIAIVRANDIKLVIIDTLSKSMRGDENSAQQVTYAMKNGVDKIRKAVPGCSVMYLHHIGKPRFNPNGGTLDIDDEVRGSSALNGFYDLHHGLRRPDVDQTYLDFTVRGNQVEEKYYTIEWTIDDEKAVFDLREKTGKYDISEKIKDKCIEAMAPEVGYTQSALAQAWNIKVPARTKQIIKSLIEEKELVYHGKKYWLP
jgi:RecA-family ATPase